MNDVDVMYDKIQNISKNGSSNAIVRNFLRNTNIDVMIKILQTESPKTYSTQKVTNIYADILKKNSLSYDFVAIQTKPDGNCFYRGASIGLFDSDKFYKLIKLGVARTLLDNEQYIMNILKHTAAEKSFESILFDCVSDGAWANEYHMLGMSIVIRCPVFCFTSHKMHHMYCAYKYAENKKPLWFIHHNLHFTILMPFTNNPSAPPPNCDQFRNYKLGRL